MKRALLLIVGLLLALPAGADRYPEDPTFKSWMEFTLSRFIICGDILSAGTNQGSPFAFAAISGGTGTTGGTTDHPGYVVPTAAAAANSGYYVGTTATIPLSDGAPFEVILQPKVITNTNFYSGFHNTLTATGPTNGVYFNSAAGVVSGKAVKASGGTTTTASTYTLTVDLWYRLVIKVVSASLATFTIYPNPGNTPLWSDSVATNIPGPTELVGVTTATFHTAGSAGLALSWIDWQCAEIPVTR